MNVNISKEMVEANDLVANEDRERDSRVEGREGSADNLPPFLRRADEGRLAIVTEDEESIQVDFVQPKEDLGTEDKERVVH